MDNEKKCKRQCGKLIDSIKFRYLFRRKPEYSTVFGTGLQHFSQAIPKGTRKGPELHIHTCVTMADLQMKLLRKKIQKRNENRKKRKLLSKQQEQEDVGMYLEI